MYINQTNWIQNVYPSKSYYLYFPNGTLFISGGAGGNTNMGIEILPVVGVYTFVFNGDLRTTGNCSFVIVDIQDNDNYYYIGNYSFANGYSVSSSLFNTTIYGAISQPGIANYYTFITPPEQNITLQILLLGSGNIQFKLLNSTCLQQILIPSALNDGTLRQMTLVQGGLYTIFVGTGNNDYWTGNYSFQLNVTNKPKLPIPRLAICQIVDACETVFNCTDGNAFVNTTVIVDNPVINQLNSLTVQDGGVVIVKYSAIIQASSISVDSNSQIQLQDASLQISNLLQINSQSQITIDVSKDPPDASYITVSNSPGCTSISSDNTTLNLIGKYSGTRQLLVSSCKQGSFSKIIYSEEQKCQSVQDIDNPPVLTLFTNVALCSNAPSTILHYFSRLSLFLIILNFI